MVGAVVGGVAVVSTDAIAKQFPANSTELKSYHDFSHDGTDYNLKFQGKKANMLIIDDLYRGDQWLPHQRRILEMWYKGKFKVIKQ